MKAKEVLFEMGKKKHQGGARAGLTGVGILSRVHTSEKHKSCDSGVFVIKD